MKNSLLDFIDFDKVNTLLEGFNKSTGFVTAILDLDGSVLSKSGWRQICTDFHRINPETSKRCTISDTILASKMAEGENYHFYKCLNGLVDVAVPIMVNGEHIANLFSGQFFFEEPDREFFKQRAKEFEFESEKYLEALDNVPVVSEEMVIKVMDFLHKMTQFISEASYQKLELTKLYRALEESEQQFRNLANAGPALIWTSGVDKLCNYFNETWFKFTGRTFEQEKGNGWAEGVHSEDFDKCLETYATAFEKHEPFEIEYRLRHVSGEYRWILDLGSPNFNSTGEFIGYIGQCFDITERKKAEKALNDSEKKFKTIFEMASLGIAQVNINNGRIITVNKHFENITGYSKEELMSMRFLELTHPEDRTKDWEIFSSAARGEIEYRNEKRYIKKDGTVVWVRLNVAFIRDEAGNPLRTVAICEEITDRKRAEEALRVSEEKYRVLFSSFPLGITISNKSGNIVESNAQAEKLLGISSNEQEVLRIDGENWRIIRTDGKPMLPKEFASVRALKDNRLVENVEMGIVKSDKDITWINVTAAPLDLQNYGVAITYNDISDRKQAEQALIKQNNALSRLNQISIEFSMLASEKNIEELITKKIKEISGAEVALFSEYNAIEKTTSILHIEMESGLYEKVVGLLGKQLKKMQSPVSDKVYNELISERIGVRKTLYEASFRAISRPVGSAIQAMLNVDRFIGLAYVLDGKLYGTSLLAMGKGLPDPSKEILENFINLAAISIKRKQAEEKLRESETRFRKIYEDGANGMVMASSDFKFLMANREFCQMTGYNEEELQQLTFVQITHPDDIAKDSENVRKLISGEVDVYRTEKRYIRKNNQTFWAQLTVSPINDTLGQFLYFVGVIVDITDRRQAEQELIALKNELEEKVNEQTQELKVKIKELEEFKEITLNREFRIAELRDEIKRLKGEQ
jgi:PAS domain S-box-containing protein